MLFYYDPLYYILVLPAVVLAVIAQTRVHGTFRKYSQWGNSAGMTGAQAARYILERNGVQGGEIEQVPGELTDHYDPRTNVIRLSQSVYGVDSCAAIGVAAHEAGHAVQYAKGYGPIRLRQAIIPVTQVGSNLAIPLVLIGLLFYSETFFALGIFFFALSTVFQLLTLPVEFNASGRAMEALRADSALTEEDLEGARRVLSAAALTYVAALAVSLVQLLRLILLFLGRSGRSRR